MLRYHLGGEPIWYAEKGLMTQPPPVCENCGGERGFEMQVQPPLIALFNTDRLEWGTVCIYTCKESCEPPSGTAYQQEFCFVQPEPEWA